MALIGEAVPTAPVRTCIGCRARDAQSRLLRFERRSDGHVIPALVARDVRGRTAYSCPRRSCFDRALERRAFARAFGSGRRRPSVLAIDADALWAATLEQLRREIELLDRTAENPHAHPRRRGLEQLLSELSSPPQPPERSASPTVLPSAEAPVNQAPATHTPVTQEPAQKGGAPSHG
jgi:uncharacterized protein